MKFVSITSDEVKEALLEGNCISVQKQSYSAVRYDVDNPSDVDEHFKYDNEREKMFFGYVTNGEKNKYVFLLMQTTYSSDTEKCLDSLINLITSLTVDIKQKSSKIKDLESVLEDCYATEQVLVEVDKFNDSLDESESNIKSTIKTINNQVKLPSQKSYITIDSFDMFT